jgi:hypothetical protein
VRGTEEEGWRFELTREPCSVLARGPVGPPLLFVAGRQVATSDGLEVLALGAAATFADGEPLESTLAVVRRSGALPVLPWGFGKWSLARGRMIEELLRRGDPAELFLGDNGGRLRWGRLPPLFAFAAERGFRILPGTDPLPFPHHGGRAGSFGFQLPVPLDSERPAAAIFAALRDRHARPVAYGRGERLLPFLVNQAGMQWRKRFPAAAS